MAAYDVPPVEMLWHLVLGLAVLFLPGLAWQAWFAGPRDGWGRRLADAMALSLGLYALVGLAAFLIGLSLPASAVLPLYVVLALLALAPWVLGRRRARGNPLALLSIGLGLGLVLAWRLVQVDELVLPPWVDPIHHVLIVRLFLENGGVPESFAPLLPIPFYYHYTFHLVTALFAAASRLSPAVATLLMGQALNAAVALGAFRLGLALWDDVRRAGVAALVVAFATQMPAYYATWGRYTLLAGLVLLTAAMATAVEIGRRRTTLERAARLAVCTGGLLITHYFLALLLAMFYLVLFALELTRGVRGPRVRRRSRVWTAWLAGGLVGAAAASPWLLRVWRYARSFTRLRAVSTGQPLDAVYFSDYLPYLWYLMGPRRNHLILALGVFGLAVVGWRWRGRPLALWTVGLLLIALPWGPQLAPFRPDHAVILFFLPAALFLAGGLVAARDRLAGAGLRALGDALVGGIVFGLLLWGVRETREILNPVTVFAQAGDVHAIEWVADNTPEQARFFINVALWQTGLYRGVDGGWWLLPLAGRETVVPPAVYPMGDQAYVADVNAAAQQAMAFQGCTLELRRFLEEQALEYVYLGPTPGPLSVEEVQDCAYLHPVYDRDGVTIFRFSP